MPLVQHATGAAEPPGALGLEAAGTANRYAFSSQDCHVSGRHQVDCHLHPAISTKPDAFLLAQQVTGKAALQVLQLQERGASVQHLCGKHAHAQTARDVGLA
jgi:hypothetical protein